MSQICSQSNVGGGGNFQQQSSSQYQQQNSQIGGSVVIPCSLTQSNHFAKKEAHHNRQATHRRTKSHFDLQTNNTRGQSNPILSNLNGVAAHSPSASTFLGTESQQTLYTGSSSLTCIQQQQYQGLQFQHSPTESQQHSQQIRENSSSSLPSAAAGMNFNGAGLQINNFINGKEQLSPQNTSQMIQLMQIKQTQEKQQIIETIDQDFQKFNSSNSMNNGFNFGKSKAKAQQKNAGFFNETKSYQNGQNQINTNSSNNSNGQSQNYNISSQNSQQGGQSSYSLAINSTQNQIGQNNCPPSAQNLSQSSSLNLLALYGNHANALQTIPEQEVSSMECPNISHPGSTRNQEEKKIVFHSHSSSYSNPQVSQQFSPIIHSNQPIILSSHSSASNIAAIALQQGQSIGEHNHSNSLNSTTFQRIRNPSQFSMDSYVNTNGALIQGTEDREYKISSAREHYKTSDQSSLTNITPKMVITPGNTSNSKEQKFFSSVKKQQQQQQQQQQIIGNSTNASSTLFLQQNLQQSQQLLIQQQQQLQQQQQQQKQIQDSQVQQTQQPQQLQQQNQAHLQQMQQNLQQLTQQSQLQQSQQTQSQQLQIQTQQAHQQVLQSQNQFVATQYLMTPIYTSQSQTSSQLQQMIINSQIGKHKKQSSLTEDMDTSLKITQVQKFEKTINITSDKKQKQKLQAKKSPSNLKLRIDQIEKESGTPKQIHQAQQQTQQQQQQQQLLQIQQFLAQANYNRTYLKDQNCNSDRPINSAQHQHHSQSQAQNSNLLNNTFSLINSNGNNDPKAANRSDRSIHDMKNLKIQMLHSQQQQQLQNSLHPLISSQQQNTSVSSKQVKQFQHQQIQNSGNISSSKSNPTLHQRKSSALVQSNNTNLNSNSNSSSQQPLYQQFFPNSPLLTKTLTDGQQQQNQQQLSQQQSSQSQQQQLNQKQKLISQIPQIQQFINNQNNNNNGGVLSGNGNNNFQGNNGTNGIISSNSLNSLNSNQNQQSLNAEQNKIQQLESIVLDLRKRMQQMEGTNKFLINKINFLLDEKQNSDKKEDDYQDRIQNLERIIKQNNEYFATIRKLLFQTNQPLQPKIDQSTHIFTDISSNESHVENHPYQIQTKDNLMNQFLSLNYQMSSPNTNQQNSPVLQAQISSPNYNDQSQLQNNTPLQNSNNINSNPNNQTSNNTFLNQSLQMPQQQQQNQHLKQNRYNNQNIVQLQQQQDVNRQNSSNQQQTLNYIFQNQQRNINSGLLHSQNTTNQTQIQQQNQINDFNNSQQGSIINEIDRSDSSSPQTQQQQQQQQTNSFYPPKMSKSMSQPNQINQSSSINYQNITKFMGQAQQGFLNQNNNQIIENSNNN